MTYGKQVLAILKLFDHGETERARWAIPIGAHTPENVVLQALLRDMTVRGLCICLCVFKIISRPLIGQK